MWYLFDIQSIFTMNATVFSRQFDIKLNHEIDLIRFFSIEYDDFEFL